MANTEKKSIEDFLKLILKLPENLRDNAYFTINGMVLATGSDNISNASNEG